MRADPTDPESDDEQRRLARQPAARVLVTGGSRGIGAATSLLCRRSAAGRWRSTTRATAAAAEARGRRDRGRGRPARSRCRPTSPRGRGACAMFETHRPRAAAARRPGQQRRRGRPSAPRVDAMSAERLQRMFAINVFGSFVCAREAVRRMTTRPGSRRPRRRPRAAARSSTCRRPRRSSARPGSTSTTPRPRARSRPSPSAWRRKWRPRASASTRCGPGSSRPRSTPRAACPTGCAQMAPLLPMQRAGTAEEVAEAIVWLLSDAAPATPPARSST